MCVWHITAESNDECFASYKVGCISLLVMVQFIIHTVGNTRTGLQYGKVAAFVKRHSRPMQWAFCLRLDRLDDNQSDLFLFSSNQLVRV